MASKLGNPDGRESECASVLCALYVSGHDQFVQSVMMCTLCVKSVIHLGLRSIQCKVWWCVKVYLFPLSSLCATVKLLHSKQATSSVLPNHHIVALLFSGVGCVCLESVGIELQMISNCRFWFIACRFIKPTLLLADKSFLWGSTLCFVLRNGEWKGGEYSCVWTSKYRRCWLGFSAGITLQVVYV